MDFSVKIEKIELRVLKADEDKVLTNGEVYSGIGGAVYLGINDTPENWREITKEEYEVLSNDD